jgi:hypothetical protein
MAIRIFQAWTQDWGVQVFRGKESPYRVPGALPPPEPESVERDIREEMAAWYEPAPERTITMFYLAVVPNPTKSGKQWFELRAAALGSPADVALVHGNIVGWRVCDNGGCGETMNYTCDEFLGDFMMEAIHRQDA